jgi:hypothetical protein
MRNSMKMMLLAFGAVSMTAIATPAMATTVVSAPTAIGCNFAPLSPAADSCAGYYDQNVFSNSTADVTAQQNAIDLLLGPGNYTVDYNALVGAGDVISGGDLAALNALLAGASGQVLLGIHWGNVPDGAGPSYGNVSGFYLWNNAAPGTIQLTDSGGFSDAVLYRSTGGAVPEPATWAMMLLGFAGIGASMRRRTKQTLMQIA